MGASESKNDELLVLRELRNRPLGQVIDKLKRQSECGRSNVLIKKKVVSKITDIPESECDALMHMLSIHQSQEVNFVTLAALMLCIADTTHGEDIFQTAVATIFDLIDTNRSIQITFDDLVILLFSVTHAISIILQNSKITPNSQLVNCAKRIFNTRSTHSSQKLTKRDFIQWCEDNLKSPCILEEVYELLLQKE